MTDSGHEEGKEEEKPPPRRKWMRRPGRISNAKATDWVKKYKGKNLVRGYCKWYGVDAVCAIYELRQLGVEISEEREAKIREGMASGRPTELL